MPFEDEWVAEHIQLCAETVVYAVQYICDGMCHGYNQVAHITELNTADEIRGKCQALANTLPLFASENGSIRRSLEDLSMISHLQNR